MKVALVHDWLVTYRGGEKVLEAVCELFPGADLYTLVHKPGGVSPLIEDRRIHTSFLQSVPGVFERYRHLLPLMPAAISAFRLGAYDLVLSSSHCVAKGIRKPSGARHLSYVHAPMRYMWDLFDDYFGPGRASPAVRLAARTARPWLQRWDRQSARGVDRFVANSRHIASKIERYYDRPASVVNPPVELERFASQPLEGCGQGGYFLWLGAFAPYKRLDLAIEAFAELGLPLWVGGSGQDAARFRSVPKNVRMLGQVSDEDLPGLYRNARALLFTGEEDFGITPLEAQASGRPVIALGRGGALETVTPRTGLFFHEQSARALADTVRDFDGWEAGFRPEDARQNALGFGKARFQQQLMAQVEAVMSGLAESEQAREPGRTAA
jgi:glycosyltransferase involved in cell wall biosynthesis